MFIVKNISKDTNESSWLIYSRMHTTRLVLEPVVAEVSVNVRGNSINFVEPANRVHTVNLIHFLKFHKCNLRRANAMYATF